MLIGNFGKENIRGQLSTVAGLEGTEAESGIGVDIAAAGQERGSEPFFGYCVPASHDDGTLLSNGTKSSLAPPRV